jgi:hypothetical protein
MLTKTKKEEIFKQVHELMARSEESIIEMIGKASTCGALTPDMKEEGNYLLAKALVTIYFRREPWGPTDTLRADVENLSCHL